MPLGKTTTGYIILLVLPVFLKVNLNNPMFELFLAELNCFLYTPVEDSTSLFEKSEAYVSSPVLHLNCETLISPDDPYLRIKYGQLKTRKKKKEGRNGGR